MRLAKYVVLMEKLRNLVGTHNPTSFVANEAVDLQHKYYFVVSFAYFKPKNCFQF
jgi:hypothetical protein